MKKIIRRLLVTFGKYIIFLTRNSHKKKYHNQLIKYKCLLHVTYKIYYNLDT